MRSCIKLFKGVPVNNSKFVGISPEIMKKTIPFGFVLSPKIFGNYSKGEIDNIIEIVRQEIGLSAEQMNSSFHKSWAKIRDSDIRKLLLEQIFHYITTYGYEEMGIYNSNSVFIPSEALNIPELEIDGLNLTVIKGYTIQELKEKLLQLLSSGIALHEDTIGDVTDLATYLGFNSVEISKIKNKEVRCALFGYLDLFPKDPIEFLRYMVYKSINKTLLIKNKKTIEEIKSKDNLNIINIMREYDKYEGFKKLGRIFYRFKPLFLAFRTNKKLKIYTNKIRKLAKKYHKPMAEDYLNQITSLLSAGHGINLTKLNTELGKANTFRKIRLAYALKFRMNDPKSILYKIRNGKSYAKEFSFYSKFIGHIYIMVMGSIVKDLAKNVDGKRIYIPYNFVYALPATEKQFTGMLPSGSYIKTTNNMIVGVHWNNVENHRIDLDLSMINNKTKMGWDGNYRDSERNILFSGDVTDASGSNGASELYYVKNQESNSYVIFLNYYNYSDTVEVPYSIIVARDRLSKLENNYMVDPNKVLCTAKSKIAQKQKILGLLVIDRYENKFYFSETSIGSRISSSGNEYTMHALRYLLDFYTNTIDLNDLLEMAGAIITYEKEECDIDLSFEKLEKDTILNLLK